MVDDRVQRLLGIGAMRADLGWLHYLLHFVAKLPGPARSMARGVQDRLRERTDARSADFDREFGVETFERSWVKTELDGSDGTVWGYGPINQDFFREIMRAVPVSLAPYTFVDIGAGKGAAVLLASEFAFKHQVGVDLYDHLLEVARENVQRYRRTTGRTFAPEWVQSDIMTWNIPADSSLYFLNDPFPRDLSVRVVRRLEQSVREAPRPSLLVYRKPPNEVCHALRASDVWRPLKITPYWRIYGSPQVRV